MTRSCLRNKFLNEVSLIEKHVTFKEIMLLVYYKKKQFYSNLKTNVLTENRTFWKTVNPNIKTTDALSWLKIKNKSKTFRIMETNADEFKKFIEKLDPKRLLKKLL